MFHVVPPSLDGKDPKENDLNDLREYYMICEDMGVADYENIQLSFFNLMKWAGHYKFLEEFIIFRKYVDKIVEEKKANNK